MNTFYKNNSPLLTGITVVLFLVVVATFQSMYDRSAGIFSRESFRFTIKHRSIIPAELVKRVAFGFDNVLADYYWISAVQDFTGWDHQDEFYLNYFKNITALDPRFSYPYYFAILTIPTEKDSESIDKVAKIADLGIEALPNHWEIPFYMGTQFNLFEKNTERALHYLSIAANNPNAPSIIRLSFASLTAKDLLGRKSARKLMEAIRDTTDSETIKKIAEHGIEVEEFRRILSNAVIAYKAKFKTYPKTVEDLTSNKFLSIPENLQNELAIIIDQANGTVKLIQKSTQ